MLVCIKKALETWPTGTLQLFHWISHIKNLSRLIKKMYHHSLQVSALSRHPWQRLHNTLISTHSLALLSQLNMRLAKWRNQDKLQPYCYQPLKTQSANLALKHFPVSLYQQHYRKMICWELGSVFVKDG